MPLCGSDIRTVCGASKQWAGKLDIHHCKHVKKVCCVNCQAWLILVSYPKGKLSFYQSNTADLGVIPKR